MNASTFAALAEPTRLRILEALRASERCVNELVEQLALPQPTVSKHLRVLRDAGLVSVHTDAQQRIYRVEPSHFEAMRSWATPYVERWSKHPDRLERHLE